MCANTSYRKIMQSFDVAALGVKIVADMSVKFQSNDLKQKSRDSDTLWGIKQYILLYIEN